MVPQLINTIRNLIGLAYPVCNRSAIGQLLHRLRPLHKPKHCWVPGERITAFWTKSSIYDCADHRPARLPSAMLMHRIMGNFRRHTLRRQSADTLKKRIFGEVEPDSHIFILIDMKVKVYDENNLSTCDPKYGDSWSCGSSRVISTSYGFSTFVDYRLDSYHTQVNNVRHRYLLIETYVINFSYLVD